MEKGNQPGGKRIKNKRYRDFLAGKFIQTIGIEEMEQVMQNIGGKNKQGGRALVTILYYTGARPTEVLNLKGENIKKAGDSILIHFETLKHGKPRTLSLPLDKPYIEQTWEYIQKVYPKLYLFRNFRSEYKREVKLKDRKDSEGNIIEGEVKEYPEVAAKLRYYFEKWFVGLEVCPYLLRHNRFSIMSERGASNEDIKEFKGAKSIQSVDPYVHLSKRRAKSFEKYL